MRFIHDDVGLDEILSPSGNGVVIHRDEPIPHATGHALDQRHNEPRDARPLRLQDHGNAIQFRNIWIAPAAQ